METPDLLARLEVAPVIAAVKDDAGLEQSLKSDSDVIFLLYGDVLHISTMVERVRKAGKAIFVHVDLVDGLAAREAAVDFLASATHADGILTTKPQLIRRARQQGLIAIQRCFLLDSMALKNTEKHLSQDKPDLVEILPGLHPAQVVIPKFTLQPLVENSIRHGITRQDPGITIRIRAREENGLLIVEVTDTGRGGDAALLNAYLDYQDVQLQVTHGFGIRNVNERLMLRFGQRGGLRYFNYDGRQLLARLTLPSECDAASDTWP